VLIPKV